MDRLQPPKRLEYRIATGRERRQLIHHRWQPYNKQQMSQEPRFTLVYAKTFLRHLKLVAPKHHSLIRKTLENQLQYEPEVRTRNRKPLKKPLAFEAEWELRFGRDNSFRVFYRVHE